MPTTTHSRSLHIDAPVATVFDYVKDPHNFYDVISEVPGSGLVSHMKAELTDVSMTPDGGVGTTYAFRGKLFIFNLDAVLTREDFAVNERIVDHSNRGVTWTSTFEPDETGTTYTLACSMSAKVPLMDKVEDLSWHGDRDLDQMLGRFKEVIEG
jgi:uncharacterized protein YndB with AHSA1/START domain